MQALCWCGRKATHNARVVDGQMVVEGAQVVVGDIAAAGAARHDAEAVEYEVLCRRHYMRRMTSHAARAQAVAPELLPFDLDLCPLPQRP